MDMYDSNSPRGRRMYIRHLTDVTSVATSNAYVIGDK